MATHLLELVHLDCLYPEPGKGRGVMGHFTHYALAYVTQSATAVTTAKVLLDNLIVYYGLPKKILLDQGRNFKSELIADPCRIMET